MGNSELPLVDASAFKKAANKTTDEQGQATVLRSAPEEQDYGRKEDLSYGRRAQALADRRTGAVSVGEE